jgi:hypothetical protein
VRHCARYTSLFCRETALSYDACIATILLESHESGWYNEGTSSVYRAEMTADPLGDAECSHCLRRPSGPYSAYE